MIEKANNTKNESDDDVSEKIELVDSEILKNLKTEQNEKFMKEIKSLNDLQRTRGKAAKVFRLKGDIVGKKKNPQEPTAVKDPVTGNTVTDPTEINEIIIKFVQKLHLLDLR